jgi:hypothetical protein
LSVLVILVQGRKRKKRVSRSERQRVLEQAREAANRFDYRIKNFIHHDQVEKSDKQKLIAWLELDRGYAQVAEDYQVFLKTANY